MLFAIRFFSCASNRQCQLRQPTPHQAHSLQPQPLSTRHCLPACCLHPPDRVSLHLSKLCLHPPAVSVSALGSCSKLCHSVMNLSDISIKGNMLPSKKTTKTLETLVFQIYQELLPQWVRRRGPWVVKKEQKTQTLSTSLAVTYKKEKEKVLLHRPSQLRVKRTVFWQL